MKEIKTRFPDGLHSEATVFASATGVSLNGFVMMAVREYLDRRLSLLGKAQARLDAAPPEPAPVQPPPALAAKMEQLGLKASGPGVYAFPGSRSSPCPCGRVDVNGYRLKWKHCHGKEG